MTRLGRPFAVLSTFALAVTLLVGPPPPEAAALPRTTATLAVISHVRQHEAVYMSGFIKADGKAQGNRTVWVQFRRLNTTAWKTVATVKTAPSGSWAYRERIKNSGQWRAYVPQTSSATNAYSAGKNIIISSAARDLPDRHASLSFRGGDASTIKGVRARDNSKVRYMNTNRPLFIEWERNGVLRTWIVEGDIKKRYIGLGHARSQLGLPLGDAECNLLENGCLQRFQNGVLYDNSSSGTATVYYGDPNNMTEVFAVAKSQVGYSAPSSNISKYNKWVGTNNAWCSIFQSWVGAASGHDHAIKTYGTFASFHTWAINNHSRTRTPRVGSIAFFDTHLYDGRTAATHAGLVVEVNGSYITTIEGNTTNPATGKGRGVYYKTRRASQPLYYINPKY